MLISLFKKALAVLTLATTAMAGQVLIKQVPPPAAGGVMTGWRAAAGGTASRFPHRSTSDGTFSYQTGHFVSSLVATGDPSNDSVAKDGWLAKVDAFGAVVWTKSIREIVGGRPAYTRGDADRIFTALDVLYAGGSIYVCGQAGPVSNVDSGWGYIARITPDGTLQNFSYIEPGEGWSSRAVALAAAVLPGGLSIAVAGDFGGTTLGVKTTTSAAASDFWSTNMTDLVGRTDNGSVSDVFAVTFNKELSIGLTSFTLGVPTRNDYATAVAYTNDGQVTVAMDIRMGNDSAQLSTIDNSRRVYYNPSQSGLMNESSFPNDVSLALNNRSPIVKVNPATFRITASHSVSTQSDGTSSVTDMVLDNGQLFVTGSFVGALHPSPSSGITTIYSQGHVLGSASSPPDIFAMRMDATSLTGQRAIVLHSPGTDRPTRLVVGADAVYLAGRAGSSLTHVNLNSGQPVTTLTTGGTAPHSFWMKLSRTDLNKEWLITPYENPVLGIGLPPDRISAGAGMSLAGANLLLTADNEHYLVGQTPPLTLSMGTASNYNTAAHNTAVWNYPATGYQRTGGGVFNVVVKPDGTYVEEVGVTVLSAYGSPTPHRGLQKMPAGQTVKFAVEPIIYENAAGATLDPTNAALIRSDAVTRRICTGYTVRNSTVNGTANTLDYTVNGETEITFLWRTDHALEVKTQLPAGVTSEAAGSPSPEVNKHWIAAGSPVIAQIDGAHYNEAEPGVRYRNTGYTATGPAIPAGGASGAFVPWGSFQTRQQVPQFTLTSPVTLVWQWQKELSIRVATIPATAGGGATATAGGVTATGDGEFWFTPGSSVTLTSPALRDAGRKFLLGYSNGVGSVIPSTGTADDGALSATITLNLSSRITWNYGANPVRKRVTIGDFADWSGMKASVVNTRHIGMTVLSDAPVGTDTTNAIAYEPAGRRILPLRPGRYLLEFNDPAVDVANVDSEDNVTMEITAGYQGDPVPKTANPVQTFAPAADPATYQTYVASSPAVLLDTSATDTVAWQSSYSLNNDSVAGLALTGGNAVVDANKRFSATEPGTSVLVFSKAAAGLVGRGNLESESFFLRVVKCRLWSDVNTADTAIVGAAIAPPATHDLAAIGHNGYVFTNKAPYNVTLHDNASLQGPVFPVNTPIDTELASKLIIAWYNRDTALATNWPSSTRDYTVSWPTPKTRIVIASRLGSEGKDSDGVEQTIFTAGRYSNLAIYNQPDKALPGYNPNEEHALLAPSFLDASRQAVFALQNGSMNITTAGPNYTSQPFVLAQYTDTTGTPAVSTPKMAVFKVEFEDAATTDSRLPAYNQKYTPDYEIVAGRILTPPWPLPILYGATPWPTENIITNLDASQRSAWQDRKKQWWAVSGDTDVAPEVSGSFYYPRRADFFHATLDVNAALPVLNDTAKKFNFNTVWPANIAVLKNGETITHSGGEAFSDGKTPNGLPSVVGMASAEIVYDHANKTLDPAAIASSWVARVINPLSPVEVDLPLADVPDSLKPAGGNVVVDGLLWRFKKLNAGMQQRLYYDAQRGKLGFRGYLNGRLLGDRELTAAPPAINLLQPNIMTAAEKADATAVDSDAKWTAAVDAVFKASRDPVDKAAGFTVGLKKDGSNLVPAGFVGPGMAIIPNPDLANPSLMTAVTNDGYFTFAENNAATLGDAPIALHIVKLDRTQKFRGAIAPIYPENVFDEKITLRHSGDFGGNVGNLVFQWYYREEDGTNANPPGVAFPSPPGAPAAGRWTLFGEILGGNEISLAGASAALLADNLFFCQWRHQSEATTGYSDYAGAANSRPPVVGSPSIATDAAYVPQLAEGWVKRVTNAVNAFDARIRDFRNNSAPSTAVSMLQQAGGRWEGNVAFNPSKDVIENYGLIELYQTVLNRAADLSINLQPGTSGVNTALLNAANRIASLYTLLGNEASTDAINPTIGFGTTSGQYGNLAPTIFCFQNQTGNLLEEELALLRGRGEIGARPAYNRLMWNFTNGQGEAAYVTNYGITDMTNDGFLDANDAAKLYPQGHGDAWGHYTMALRGYAGLFRAANFAWDTRSEKYQINGVVFDIDYMDERAFAETAAARAKAGAAIVDLVYRQKYTENPAGQWQGYQDTNTDRAWGVYESAQRVATGGLFDWVTANALLPSSDDTKEGITRVDRTTVGALKEIASNAAEAQNKLDMADNALNPLGLDSETVPFDIDPARVDRGSVAPATHFEQVYERAVTASQNALTAFNYANSIDNMLRRTASSAEQLRQQTIDQDRSYRNQLIELFGTPYEGQIGAGKMYPAGYTGPDLYLHMYVPTVEISNATMPAPEKKMKAYFDALLKLDSNLNPFAETAQAAPDYTKSIYAKFFPKDFAPYLEVAGSAFYEAELPLHTKGYAFNAPADWGVRASPGKLQAALSDVLLAQHDFLMATEGYEDIYEGFTILMRTFAAKTGIAAEEIRVTQEGKDTINALNWSVAHWERVKGILESAGDVSESFAEAGDASFTGMPGKIVFAILTSVKAVLDNIADFRIDIFNGRIREAEVRLEIDVAKLGLQKDIIDALGEMEAVVNSEPDARLAIFAAKERLRAAGDRYRAAYGEANRLLEERVAFNKRVAATTTQQRYEDYTFRISRNDALTKYRSSLDLAARYAWLASRAYAYELNLPDNHPANATPVSSGILRSRTLGRFENGQPVAGNGGIAEHLAVLKTNFDSFKGQLGFNAPATQTVNFSVRSELARIGLSSRVNADWRTQLETYRVADLWNYSYSKDGVDYGQIFRRYCRPFAPESAGAQPALVIPFGSTITAGQNWFGKTLTGGDSAFNASNFATKIRAAGVKFDSYNSTAMSVTPQVYLVPVGLDRMYLPESNLLETRSWRVLDQRIPAPLAINPSQLADSSWQPFTGSATGYFEEARRYPAFRAYHDAGGYSQTEMLHSSRLVGRSVWNTQWVLIIPSNAILSDPANGAYPGDIDAGLDTFIYGAPLPGSTHAAAGTTNRDGNGVRDIRLLLQTYSLSGN